jgi:hypothetical protein
LRRFENPHQAQAVIQSNITKRCKVSVVLYVAN